MTVINSGDEHNQKLIGVKKGIISLINSGHFQDANRLILEYEKAVPDDPDVNRIKAMLALKQGNSDLAKSLVVEGIQKFPQNFELSFLLGQIFEKQEAFLDAYNSYRNAEYLSLNNSHKKRIKLSMLHLKEKLEKHPNRGMKFIPQDYGYDLIIKANEKSFKASFVLSELRQQGEILNLIISNLAPGVNKVLQIECQDGLIARFISDIGYDVLAVDAKDETRLKWIAMELNSKIRDIELNTAKYLQMDFNLEKVNNLARNYDVIIFTPRHFDFFKNYNYDEIIHYLYTLSKKANKQFFCFLPKPSEDEQLDIYNSIVNHLRRHNQNDNGVFYEITGKIATHQACFMFAREPFVPVKNVIPEGLEITKSNSLIVDVDINKCTDLNGFHYKNDFQHFVATIEQYNDNPKLVYEDSILKDYYEKFCPKNLEQQYFFEDEKVKNSILKNGFGVYPWHKVKSIDFLKERIETRPGGSHHFGPNEFEFGKDELHRVITAYKLLRQEPYQPELYADGFIYGYFLKNKGDYRFVITEGQHRIPAMATLGYNTIRCKVVKSELQDYIIDIENIKKWGQVKNGMFSRNLASQLFHKFFERRGQKVARKLGLID